MPSHPRVRRPPQSSADFVLYGPIEDAPYIFPAVAMIDTAMSQLVMERGGKVNLNHPRFRIG